MYSCSRETPLSFPEADVVQTMFIRVCLILLLAAGPLRSQVEFRVLLPAAVATDMVTPSPVNVEGTSLAFAAETGAHELFVGRPELLQRL